MNEDETMLTELLNCKRHELYLDEYKLDEKKIKTFRSMKARRLTGEPLQYIVGNCDFMGYRLTVNPHVLIPRPETELLVAHVVDLLSMKDDNQLRVLDVGSGSGNIDIALASKIDNIKITSIDVSKNALKVAKHNAELHGVEHKINFKECDMEEYFEGAIDQKDPFDLIISNPPYIKSSDMAQLPIDVKQEPALALDGGEDGCHYLKSLVYYSHMLLKDDGILACEIADEQAPRIINFFEKFDFYSSLKFFKDYTRTDRFFTVHKKVY